MWGFWKFKMGVILKEKLGNIGLDSCDLIRIVLSLLHVITHFQTIRSRYK